MKQVSRHLITSALPYANGPLHIGHLAGAYLTADIYARFLRLMGKDVAFICGSDEHGAAITLRAKKEGKEPKEIVDQYHNLFEKTFERIGISFDIYHRTSANLHHETAQDFFRKLHEKGAFLEKETEQLYDPEAEQFLADRYVKGTCPKCAHENAYGDQCENCGSTLSPAELINPVSTLSGAKPILKTTKHWFLQLDKNEDWLREWIEKGTLEETELHDPKTWKNHVVGQCKSWLDAGLQPRAMTRDLNWGVDVPREIEGHEGKKLYVWMDAPIGYISATKEWAKREGKNWQDYWMSDESSLVHFIGKDNIVFHCLIFPSILKAHGDYILPENVPANQFLNLEGDKISTSRNWAVWVQEYLDDLPEKQDELRFHLVKIMPEQRDSEFTWRGFQDSNNNELVNNLANFVNRVIVLTNKYYDGVVPAFDQDLDIAGAADQYDTSFHESELLDLFDHLHALNHNIRKYDFRAALAKVMEISSAGNQILQFNEPWKLVKTDPEKTKVVMNLTLQIVAALSVAIRPFIPFSSDKLRKMLNLDPLTENGEYLSLMDALAEGEMILKDGHQIGKPEHLFSRIPDELIAEQVAKLQKPTEAAAETAPLAELAVKDTIQYDDFMKMDIRTARIVEAKKVEKTDKLMRIELDLGFEKRTVVSGIAQHYQEDEVIGRDVLLLANLAPRKLKGIESQGMILMAENNEGKLCFVSPVDKWEAGSTVK